MVADGRIVAAPGHQLLLQLLLAQVLMSQLLKFIPDQVVSCEKDSLKILTLPPGNFCQDHCLLGVKLSRLPVTIRGARKSCEGRADMEFATCWAQRRGSRRSQNPGTSHPAPPTGKTTHATCKLSSTHRHSSTELAEASIGPNISSSAQVHLFRTVGKTSQLSKNPPPRPPPV